MPPPVRAWLDADPLVSQAEAQRIWQLAGQANSPLQPDPERIAALWQQLDTATRQPIPNSRVLSFRPSRTVAFAVAAGIALLLAVGIAFWLQPLRHVAPSGQQMTVLLPDGSSALLNSGSTLTYRRSFGFKARTVHLAGEAFFDVAHGDAVFRVATFNATIEVLGTRFNVRARSQDQQPQTVVVVETGRVQVRSVETSASPVVLTSGQSYTVGHQENETEVAPRDVAQATNWRQGGLYFRDAPLRDIFDELERRYNVEIFSNAPAVLATRRTWYKRDPGTVEALLEELCAPNKFQYRRTANGYEVFSD